MVIEQKLRWAFPRAKWTGRVTEEQQAKKVTEECVEFVQEVKQNNRRAALLELLEGMQAAECYLRSFYSDEEICNAVQQVVIKSAQKGYYS